MTEFKRLKRSAPPTHNDTTHDKSVYDSESSHQSTPDTTQPVEQPKSAFTTLMSAQQKQSPMKKTTNGKSNTIASMFSKQTQQSNDSKENKPEQQSALNVIDTNKQTLQLDKNDAATIKQTNKTTNDSKNDIKSPKQLKSPKQSVTSPKKSPMKQSSADIKSNKKRKSSQIDTETVEHEIEVKHKQEDDHGDDDNESVDEDVDDNVIGVIPVKESSTDDKYGWGTNNYNPIEAATWRNDKDKSGQCNVPYSVFAELCSRAEVEPSRLAMISMVCDFLRSIIAVSPHDLIHVVYLLINKVAPDYAGKEIGVADGNIKKALQQSTGKSIAVIDSMLNEIGDLGTVAVQCRTAQITLIKPKPLTCAGVYKSLKQMSEMSGKGTTNDRIKIVQNMIVACVGEEAKFLVRSFQGNLRIGFSEKTVIAALARAVVLGDKVVSSNTIAKLTDELITAKKILDQVYIELPNHDIVINNLLQYGIDDLQSHCYLQPGVPVKCMLGKACKSIDEIFETFENQLITVEWKYDGERAQIHLTNDNKIMIYSRNSENHTQKFPDVIKYLPNAYDHNNVKNFILDCEVVAYDIQLNKILPFQVLTHRKRKDVDEKDITVKVCLFAFDLLYLNDKSLLQETFQTRRDLLYSNFNVMPHQFYYAEKRDTDDLNEITDFMNLAVTGSCEGLMIKSLVHDSAYVPAKRNWLKLKKDYLNGMGDTMDLVVIGAWYGRGKRTGVYGAFLLAVYDTDNEEFQAVTKIGTGFSEEMLESVSTKLNQYTIEKPAINVKYANKPDVYFEPKIVWEVLCADISISPIYQAAIGIVHPEKGIALRFPRFIREREDKTAENATSTEQVVEAYESQENRKQ